MPAFPSTESPRCRPSVVHSPLQIHTLFGVVLVADHFGMDAGQIEVGRGMFAAARDDHLGFRGLANQSLHDWFHRQQLQIHGGIEFVEDHGLVETAGDGRPSNLPGPFGLHVVNRFLLASPHDRVTPRAQMIHEMRVALA